MAQCTALVEGQYGKVIEKNYHAPGLFWFELDHAQTKGLISLFKANLPRTSPMLHPVASGKKELFPMLPVNQSSALCKQELPHASPITWKDVVCKRQNKKDVKQPGNFVNENKFQLLLCEEKDMEDDNPTGSSSNVLEDVESNDPVSDWEDLVKDNVNNTISDEQYPDGLFEREEKRTLHFPENMATKSGHSKLDHNDCMNDGTVGPANVPDLDQETIEVIVRGLVDS